MVFFPITVPTSPVNTFVSRNLGFHLGTDGFSVVWYDNVFVLDLIIVQRQSLVGWHHYSIVYNNGEAFVYIDGATRDSSQLSKVIDRTQTCRLSSRVWPNALSLHACVVHRTVWRQFRGLALGTSFGESINARLRGVATNRESICIFRIFDERLQW